MPDLNFALQTPSLLFTSLSGVVFASHGRAHAAGEQPRCTVLAEEGLKGAAEGREGFAWWGRRAKVGGGMSLGVKGLLALQKPNFCKSNGVALGRALLGEC